MALCHLPSPSLLASRELQPTPSVSRLAEEHLRWGTQWSASCRALLLSCSAKKSRASRRSRVTKSNADLCNELREFVFAVGLPEDHVPSTKELLEHGRKDLAYIVRRRGYKEITKLLMKSTDGDTKREEDLANVSDFGKVSGKESIEGLETQDNMYSTPAESSHEGATRCSQSCESEIIGDSVERVDTRIHNGCKFTSKMHYADGVDEGDMGSQLSFPLTRGEFKSRFIDKNFSVQFLDELELPFRDDVSLEKILGNSDLDENNASDLTEERANQAEIDHLKELLHQKEMELTTLKQQIEKEKIALSTTQNKVQSEISKVQNIISTKDEELRAAEESLSGLEEVLIEYWGHGETVEVTGSFNGWQHRVKLDSHTASKTANSNGSREAILWTTILWLYPGIYEIKFVVDGYWKIDSQREFVTRGHITNNILRVER